MHGVRIGQQHIRSIDVTLFCCNSKSGPAVAFADRQVCFRLN